MDNIRYGRLDATDDEVIGAAKLANADQFIRRLPQGYATLLSERASNLSQGQRQLLAIARAILADPRILILDEATSSVDTRTEQHIQEAMLRRMAGRTSFVIAHRLSTIRDADQILVIKDVIAGLLREKYGFDGVVCTDWGLLTDTEIEGRTMVARLGRRAPQQRAASDQGAGGGGRPVWR
jgi:ABC-type transport system involved in Fe-S cluster assembly fused permease/ATPase subunit